MIAFIFDLALFFLARARIRSAGGDASFGNAILLTIVAWVLLFLSGIFFCCGRCCLSNRPSRKNKRSGTGDFEPGHNQYVDQVRMDAIKAEAERQAKQKYGKEGGLPAFQEFQPLNRKESAEDSAYEEGNQIVNQSSQPQLHQGYIDASSPRQQPVTGQTYAGGYMPGQPGGRAVDDYYNPSGAGYPPGPRRQATTHSQTASSYSQSTYSSPPPPTPAPIPPLPQSNSQYLAVGGGQYGHQNNGTSCGSTPKHFLVDSFEVPCVDHSAVSHQQGPSFDPYSTDSRTSPNNPPIPVLSHSPPIQQTNPYIDQYSPGGNQYLVNPHSAFSQHDPYHNPYTQGTGQRAYTLGGSGYGDNVAPDRQASPGHIPNPYVDSYGNQPPATTTSPTQMYRGGYQPAPAQALQPSTGTGGGVQYDDGPPTYNEHDPAPAGGWSSKS